jgi:lipopolysaccharide transport system ATP-binding protein
MSSSPSEISYPLSDLDPEVLIKVNNVSKKFCRDFKKSLWYGLKDTADDIFHAGKGSKSEIADASPTTEEQDQSSLPPLRPGEFWANQNISFEVKRGECLGLIGHNGAGKTTLLKMLNGLIKPDTGSIEMHGRIGALIALGAGFNPILTGRENVYVNGSILGLHKKEIDAKLEEILEFAEIEDAIDAPVRTYSSGMQVRLGFAVAAILVQPDILILDEVLAVGDMAFTIKCLNAVRQLTERSAVIFVSHNVQMVSQFCSDIMLLENGSVQTLTHDVSEGIQEYLSACNQTVDLSGTGEADVSNEILWTASGGDLVCPYLCVAEDSLGITLSLEIADSVDQAKITIVLKDNSGRPVAAFSTKNTSGASLVLSAGKHLCKFEIGDLGLTPGKYHFVVAVRALNPERICIRKDGVLSFTVSDAGHRGHVHAPISRIAKAEISTIQ